MRRFWLWIVALVIVWPIHSTAAMIGNKPIEMIASDPFVLMMPLIYLLAGSRVSKRELSLVMAPIRSYKLLPILALVFVVYATSLAAIGLGMSGETIRVYSAFKMVKPVCFVFVGLLLGAWIDPIDFIGMIGYAFVAVVGLTICTTISDPSFPMGEWGRFLYEYELCGYPNSAMSFFGCLVPILLASADISKEQGVKVVCWGAAACSALIILGSMSRSSSLVMMIGVSLYLVMTGRTAFLIGVMIAASLFSVIGFGVVSALKETDFVSILLERIRERVERSTESEDPSSGRFDIWALAIELWLEKPVFGYMFESFAKYGVDIDTPHQQYLEVLYKCGGLGLVLYLGMLVSCLYRTSRLLILTVRKSVAWYQLHAALAMLVGLMIGNLTQPNLTFSVTGNLVFLLFGCLCSSRAVVSASQGFGTTRTSTAPLVTRPVQRAAA